MVGSSSRGARALLASLTLCCFTHASPQVGSGVVPIDTITDATATMLPSNSSGDALHKTCIVSQLRVKVNTDLYLEQDSHSPLYNRCNITRVPVSFKDPLTSCLSYTVENVRTHLRICECQQANGSPSGLSCGEKEGWFISGFQREGSWVSCC